MYVSFQAVPHKFPVYDEYEINPGESKGDR